MHYLVRIIYNITSGDAINVLGTSDSFLVSKQVLRCQRDDRTCHFFLLTIQNPFHKLTLKILVQVFEFLFI